MTYGDKIRQMDDDQLACLLDIIQTHGFNVALEVPCSNIPDFECFDVSDWVKLITREIPDGPPVFGIF